MRDIESYQSDKCLGLCIYKNFTRFEQGDTMFQNLKHNSKDNHAFCFQQKIIRKLYFMYIRCL